MLVTLEGLDGSGKTTAWETLQDLDPLADATFTREPTETWYGEAVGRSIADPDADPLAELFLYTADHAAHLTETVEPALERGDVVISDRFSDSRYAYQGATLAERFEDPLQFVQQIHQPWTAVPDLTVYLDVDAETAADRSGATNKFERADYLEVVRENYETLVESDPERFVRVDASQEREAVIRDVTAAVTAVI